MVHSLNKKYILYLWIIFVVSCIVFFVFNEGLVKNIFYNLSGRSLSYVYILIFILGALRGFTLIPITYLIVLGLIFVPALPLFFIILSGVVISSLSVYYFFEYLHLDTMLGAAHQPFIKKTTYYMNKYEFPVLVFWSMNPILPTDVICYVAGTLRVNVYKFLAGILLGEGITCAVYIFGGKFLINSIFGTNL